MPVYAKYYKVDLFVLKLLCNDTSTDYRYTCASKSSPLIFYIGDNLELKVVQSSESAPGSVYSISTASYAIIDEYHLVIQLLFSILPFYIEAGRYTSIPLRKNERICFLLEVNLCNRSLVQPSLMCDRCILYG